MMPSATVSQNGRTALAVRTCPRIACLCYTRMRCLALPVRSHLVGASSSPCPSQSPSLARTPATLPDTPRRSSVSRPRPVPCAVPSCLPCQPIRTIPASMVSPQHPPLTPELPLPQQQCQQPVASQNLPLLSWSEAKTDLLCHRPLVYLHVPPFQAFTASCMVIRDDTVPLFQAFTASCMVIHDDTVTGTVVKSYGESSCVSTTGDQDVELQLVLRFRGGGRDRVSDSMTTIMATHVSVHRCT